MKEKDKKYRLLFARATENANCGSYFTTCCSDLKTLIWCKVMLTALRLTDNPLSASWRSTFLRHPVPADPSSELYILSFFGAPSFSPFYFGHFLLWLPSQHLTFFNNFWWQTLLRLCRIFTTVHFVFFAEATVSVSTFWTPNLCGFKNIWDWGPQYTRPGLAEMHQNEEKIDEKLVHSQKQCTMQFEKWEPCHLRI